MPLLSDQLADALGHPLVSLKCFPRNVMLVVPQLYVHACKVRGAALTGCHRCH
jgi:hypothetical protein